MGQRRVVLILYSIAVVAMAATQRAIAKSNDVCFPGFNKVECFAHSKLANISCSLTPVNATSKNLSLNFTFYQDEMKLNFRWKQYQKMGNNRYVPSFFDMAFDLCDTLKNFKSLPKSHPLWVYGEHLNPRLIEHIKLYARPCPLGQIQFKYLTMVKPLIGPLKLMPAADYRSDYSLSNDKFTLVTLRLYSATDKTVKC